MQGKRSIRHWLITGLATPSVAAWLMVGNATTSSIEIDDIYQTLQTPQMIWRYRNGSWAVYPPHSPYPTIQSIDAGEGFWVYSKNEPKQILTAWRNFLQYNYNDSSFRTLTRGWRVYASDLNASVLIDKFLNHRISIAWYYRDGKWYTTNENMPYKSFQAIDSGLSFWIYRSSWGEENRSLRHLYLDSDQNGIDDQIDSDADGLCDNAEEAVGTDPGSYDNDLLMRDTYADKMTLLASKELNLSLKKAWRYMSAKARSVHIAVVDSGILSSHPDLKANLNIKDSVRYPDEKGKTDPVGDESDVDHGTICAGIIAARGFNEEGICGVAPLKSLISLNVFHDGSDAAFIAALANKNADISSNSWGYASESFVEDPALKGIEEGIKKGRGGLGTVYVFAAGNEGEDAETVSDIHNSRYVMTISSVDRQGRLTDYANYGANIFVVAPGGTKGDGMVATDFNRNTWQPSYAMPSDNLQGTSFATPVVSGIAALILDANPYLSWRDVQSIIAKTANRNDPSDPSWQRNGAGMWVSEKYGFGTPNAFRAVREAFGWDPLPKEKVGLKKTMSIDQVIPDDDAEGLDSTIDVKENFTLEHVDVWVSTRDLKDEEGDQTLNHRNTCYDDFRIELISPSGTKVVLDRDQVSSLCGNLKDWHYGTHLFMGESSKGAWHLHVTDTNKDYEGVLQSWSLQLFGH